MEPKEIKNITNSILNLKTIIKDINHPELKYVGNNILEQMRQSFVEQAIVEVIEEYYEYGQVTSVSRLFGGLINQNYAVSTNDGRRRYLFFIKRYRKEATEKEIILEHKFNEHICSFDFPEVAKCVKSQDGRTFIKHQVKYLDPPESPSRFAVYTYLHGEDRYSWMTPHCTMADLTSASNKFAKIHERSFGFDAGEYAKDEPKILELMDEFPKYFSSFEDKAQNGMKDTKSANYYLEKLPSYLKALECSQLVKEKCKDMLEVTIHGDYHPGNQKYSENGVTGVFDFDWLKQDLRLFDVAITLTYFCTSWKEHENGVLFLDQIHAFLKAYQERLEKSETIYPLTKEELSLLPEMIILANMYVICWDLREIFEVEESESDDDSCLTYLVHNTKINDFALEHLEEIRGVAKCFII